MARNMPTHVRLPNEGENNDILPVGILADVNGGSGWSISGLDVKEVPSQEDEPEAYSFVRSALAQGRLEPATSSEFDLVQKTNAEIARLFPKPKQDEPPAPWNEPAIVATSRKHRRIVSAHRMSGGQETGEIEDTNYGNMSNDELRSRLANRGLDTDGTKRELVARLQEADASEEANA